MSSDYNHQVVLTAKDGASAVFAKVGASALDAAAKLQKAGGSAKTAGQGFSQAATDAQKFAQSGIGGDFSKGLTSAAKASAELTNALARTNAEGAKNAAWAKVAAADYSDLTAETLDIANATEELANRFSTFGSVGKTLFSAFQQGAGVLTDFARSAENSRNITNGLKASYGDAAGELIRFSKEMQASTNYSDEAVQSGLNLAATLTKSYGLTTEQVEQLTRRSADLAQVYSYDLPDAMQRTQSAIRGEAESAEALGLTLNDNFLAAKAAKEGITGWTTSMTDAEKAQYRFKTLLEQSNYAQGQAEKAASGSRGALIQLKDSLQDVTVGVGNALGPLTGVVAGFEDMAVAAPGAIQVSKALGDQIGPLAGKFNNLTTAMKGTVAGLGLVGGALAIGFALWEKQRQEQELVTESYEDRARIGQAVLSGEQQQLLESIDLTKDLNTQMLVFNDLINQGKATGLDWAQWNLDPAEIAEVNSLMGDILSKMDPSKFGQTLEFFDSLSKSWQTGDVQGAEFLDILDGMNRLLDAQGESAGPAAKQVDALMAAWAGRGGQGIQDGGGLAHLVEEANADLPILTTETDKARQAVIDFNKEWTKAWTASGQEGFDRGMQATTDRLNAQAREIQGEAARQTRETLDYELAQLGTGFEGNISPVYEAANQKATAEILASLDAITNVAATNAQAGFDRGMEASAARWTGLANQIAAKNQASLAPSLASGAGFGALSNDLQFQQRDDGIKQYGADLAEAAAKHKEFVDKTEELNDKAAAKAKDRYREQTQDAHAYNREKLELDQNYAQQSEEIERNRVKAIHGEEASLNKQLHSLSSERAKNERALQQELKGIEQERRDIAIQTEQQLADLAQQRGQIQQDAAQQAQQAEAEWLQTQRDAVQAQAEVRKNLQETTAQAARDWHALQQENIRALRELKEEYDRTKADETKDYSRSKTDLQTELSRLQVDKEVAAKTPGATPMDIYESNQDYDRRIADTMLELSRLEEDHAEEVKRNKEDEKKAEEDLARTRKEGAKDYKAQIGDARKEAAAQIKGIQSDNATAHAAYMNELKGIHDQATQDLSDLDGEARGILDDQATAFSDLEVKKRIAIRDTQRAQETASRDAAHAQELYARGVEQANRDAGNAGADATRDYGKAIAQLPKKYDTTLIADDKASRPVLDRTQSQIHDIRRGADVKISLSVENQEKAQSSLDKSTKARNVKNVEETTKKTTNVTEDITNQVVNISADTSDFDAGLRQARQDAAKFAQDTHPVAGLLLQRRDFDAVLKAAIGDGELFGNKVFTANLNASGTTGKAQGTGGGGSGNFFTNLQSAQTHGDDFDGTTYTAYLVLDDSKFDLESIDTSALENKTYTVAITGDRKGLVGEINAATTLLQTFGKGVYTADLAGDRQPLIGELNSATTLLQTYGRGVYKALLSAEVKKSSGEGGVADVLAGVYSALEKYDTYSVSATLGADAKTASTVIGNVNKAIGALQTKTATVKISGDAGNFNSANTTVLQKVRVLDQSTSATIEVRANTNPFWDSVNAILNKAVLGTVKINVQANQLGGTAELGARIPHAAMGRMTLVGEAGPELVMLPSGALVMPHNASQARLAAESSAAKNMGGGPIFNGPVTFQLMTSEIGKEVERQLRSRGIK